MPPNDHRMLTAALKYAEHGWHVFPLDERGKRPHRHLPERPENEGGYKFATDDAKRVETWWDAWPDANIGLHPGPSVFVVIDIDGPIGEAAAQPLGLNSEPTLMCMTGRSEGGRHLYYRHPGFHVGNVALADHIDVRADAGYTILPPSIHPTGVLYRWDRATKEVLSLPPRVLEELPNQNRGSSEPLPLSDLTDGLMEGVRHETLKRWIGRWLGKGLTVEEVTAVALAVNAQHGQPALDDREVLQMVEWTASREAQKVAGAEIVPLATYRRLAS